MHIKGAKVWDFLSLRFSLFLHHKAFLGRDDFVVKILTYYFNFWGSQASFIFWCKLSIRVRSWCVCSACAIASVPYAHAQCKHLFQTRMLSIDWRPFSNLEFLRLCWAYAKGTDAYTLHAHQFLMRMLSRRISSWPVCSGYASVPDAYAQHVLKGLRSLKRPQMNP